MYLPAKCNGNPESDSENVTARKQKVLRASRDIYPPRYWRNLNLASIGPPCLQSECIVLFAFLIYCIVNSHDAFGLGGVLLKGGGGVDPEILAFIVILLPEYIQVRLWLLHATLLIPRQVRLPPAQSEAGTRKSAFHSPWGKRIWNR